MRRYSRNFLGTAAILSLGLTLGVVRDVRAEKPPAVGAGPGDELPWADARMLAEVMNRVERDYVSSVDDHTLLQAAIRGMVSSLDPYSQYLDGEEYDEIKISSSGQYSGVGIEVSMQDDQVIVVTPFEGSPAAKAGIRTGDVIASIDDVPVKTDNVSDTIGRMRGKEGTTVKIGILRQGNSQPLEFVLQRSKVEVHSVRFELPQKGYGYLRIAEFSETTGDDTVNALRALRKRNGGPLKGLVLDLRNNPGGVLEAAVAVADAFLDHGLIVSAKGRTPESNFAMSATPGDDLAGAPIVVLVNGGSASAAEIVAGALKDHRRARLLGHTTFGKGSVQTVMPLSGDSGIKLTTSLYYTPSGVSINHHGIAPDIELPGDVQPAEEGGAAPDKPAVPLEERDADVKRAIEELKLPSPEGPSITASARAP